MLRIGEENVSTPDAEGENHKKVEKSLLTIFNVGQGDCFLLHDLHNDNSGNPYLIDCGPKASRILPKLKKALGNLEAKKINLILTHSHRDHIGGVCNEIIENSKAIYIPKYLPEIMRIHGYLKKHLRDDTIKFNFKKIFRGKRIIPIWEGDARFKEFEILNPPKLPNDIFKGMIKSPNINLALKKLTQYGIELKIDDIINYSSPLIDVNADLGSDYAKDAQEFVHLFFRTLSRRIGDPRFEMNDMIIQSHFDMTSNQASLVFRYMIEDDLQTLFTGDADMLVFNRIIKSHDIKAKILKVPHHGSRNSLDLGILKKISPKFAIISHKNGQFGKSTDTHPHFEVLYYLMRIGAKTLFTNDVMKKNKCIAKMTKEDVEINEKYRLEFI